MIQTIGIMIGVYIFTRMVEILGGEKPGPGTKLCAWLTLLVAIVGTISLFFTSMPTGLR
jgi:hypothetical protein